MGSTGDAREGLELAWPKSPWHEGLTLVLGCGTIELLSAKGESPAQGMDFVCDAAAREQQKKWGWVLGEYLEVVVGQEWQVVELLVECSIPVGCGE